MTTLVRRGLLVLTCLAGAVLLLVLVLPRLLGQEPYVVTSGSMVPTFDPGAVVLVEEVDPADLTPGDIVTFQGRSGPVTHRLDTVLVGRPGDPGARTFLTRGDANNAPDAEVLTPDRLLGRATFVVPRVGYVVQTVQSPVGAGLAVALVLGLVLSGGRRSPSYSSGPDTEPTEDPSVRRASSAAVATPVTSNAANTVSAP